MSANLETLELAINGNAENASGGIDKLIGSLSALSDGLVKPYSDLKDFNEALKELKTLSAGIKFSGLSNATKAIKQLDLANNNGRGSETPQWALDAQKRADARLEAEKGMSGKTYYDKYPESREIQRYQVEAMERYRKEQSALQEVKSAIKDVTGVRQSAVNSIKTETKQTNELKTATEEATTATKAFGEATQEALNQDMTGNSGMISKLKEGFSSLTEGIVKGFNRVKRIATTMLIRSAIRGLIKAMKEGVGNVYEWSKATGGEFAKTMDKASASVQTLKNSVGAALSPAISALVPILNSVTSAVIRAFNAVNQFIALLSGKSSWTKAVETATEATDDLKDSASGAGAAAKEMLAAFDELNVITSESGGGGGGGSTLTEDFSGMFEEIDKFDEKIRAIADFLNSSMESIKAMAIATGGAILAWKLGNAFAEVLPTLSKIMGFASTGLTIAITLQAVWELTNEYLNTGDEGWLFASALASAVGSTAAWAIAKKLIGGQAGTYAAAFTLAMSAVTDIVADIKNTNVDALSKESILTRIKAALEAGAGAGIFLHAIGLSGWALFGTAAGAALAVFAIATLLKVASKGNTTVEWGDLELTEEQIQEYVRSKMFAAETNLKIEKFNVLIDEKANLEEDIRTKVSEIYSEMNVLSLGIDKEETLGNITTLLGDQTSGLIKDVSDLCDINISMLKLSFGNVTMYDSEGNPMSADTLLTGIEGWNNVKKAMDTNGAELTRLLFKSATKELTPEEKKYEQELFEKVTGMATRIAEAEEFGNAAAAFKTAALSAMSESSFTGIIEAFKQLSASNESTIRTALMEQISSWYALASVTDDPELKAEYTRIADELSAGFETTVKEELAKQNAPGVEMIKEWLFGRHGAGSATVDWDEDQIREYLDADGLADTIRGILLNNDFTQAELDVMDLIGFTGFEFLSKELQDLIVEFVTVTPDTVNTLKDQLGLDASQIFKFANWNEFKRKEKLEFLSALDDAFGASEALKAAKNAGINIGALVSEGMGSSDANIRAKARNWNEILKKELDDKSHEAKVKTVWEKGKDGNTVINGFFNSLKTFNVTAAMAWLKGKDPKESWNTTTSGWNPIVGVTAEFKNNKDIKTATTKQVKEVNKSKPTITLGAGYGKGSKPADIKAAYQKEKPKVVVAATVAAGFVTNLANDVKKATASGLKGIKVNIKPTVNKGVNVEVTAATGGLFSTGQTFIAREQGPELVGTIGNKSAVVNNDQIVESVSSGVAKANSEQNALLRQQNEILYEILAKAGNGGLGASSALGRVVSQSLDMYHAMTGGR